MNCKDIAPPALILAFRRPENIANCIETLNQAGTTRIYLAVDGPREGKDLAIAESIVELARDYCQKFNIQLFTLRRSENLGLALSVLTALDWFFSLESEGLVLEDDLVFSQEFVAFCDKSLKFFKDDNNVWIVSGNNFIEGNSNKASITWSTYPMIWGWATWSSKWPEIRSAILSENIYTNRNMNFQTLQFWKTGIRRVNLGILNSWAVPLAAQMKSRQKFCVIPPVNLVSNVGVDKNAEHTAQGSWHSNRKIENLPENYILTTEDREALAKELDKVFDSKIYLISWKSIFSFVLSILTDFMRFPRKNRRTSLSSRFVKYSNSN